MVNPESASSQQTPLEPFIDLVKDLEESRTMKFQVIVEQDEDGIFVAECPTLPGCVSQGKTRAEALGNIKDAIQGYLHSLKKHGEPVPLPITQEVVEVSE